MLMTCNFDYLTLFTRFCGFKVLVRANRLGCDDDLACQIALKGIALFRSGQVEGDEMAVEIGLQVDLGGESATGAAERLTLLPPLAPAAETWARTMVESNICTR